MIATQPTACARRPFARLPYGRHAPRRQRAIVQPQPAVALGAEELAMCARMGVAPAAYHWAALGDLIVAALRDGRLTPAQKRWAEQQSLRDLRAYLDASR